MRYTITILLLSIYYLVLSAQTNTLLWERHYGGANHDAITTTFENMQGTLVAVGKTGSKLFKKEEVLLRFLDKEGQVLVKQNFGGKKNDAANAAIQLYDGSYLLAGYTNSTWEDSKGKTDAWLVRISEGGKPIWNHCYGMANGDRFEAVLQMPNGDLVAVGHADDYLFAARIAVKDGAVIWQQQWVEHEATAYSIALDDQEQIALTGTTTTDKGKRMFFAKLNSADGTLVNFQLVGEQNNIVGYKIIYDGYHQEYLLGGTAFYAPSREDMALVKLDKKGKVLWEKRYGGTDKDEALDLALTDDDTYLLAGLTRSHLRGARRKKGYLLQLNRAGERVPTGISAIGGKYTDTFEGLYSTNTGEILLSGTTNSNSNGLDFDAWLVKIATSKPKSIPPSKLELSITDLQWNEENTNDTLDAEERGYLSFELSNPSEVTIKGLKVILNASTLATGVKVYAAINLTELPRRSTKKFSIPISGDYDLQSGENLLDFTLLDADGETIQRFNYRLQSKAQPLPLLEIVNGAFETLQSGLPERKEVIKLHLTIKNNGTAAAQEVGSRFFLPKKIAALSPDIVQNGALQPGDSTTITLDFRIKSYYEYDSLNITCVAFEKTKRRGAHHQYGLKIRNFYDIPETPNSIINPKNNFLKNTTGGPNGMDDFEISFDTKPVWRTPEGAFDGYEIQHDLNYINVQLIINSAIELEDNDFQLWLNGEAAIDGQTMDKNYYNLREGQSFDGTNLIYGYTNKVWLEEGSNTITLKIRSENGWVASDPMTIHVTLARPNLHIYAFGVPYKGENELKYTSNDVQDFTNAFAKQKGQLFDSIHISTYTSEEETQTQLMREAIEDIYNDFTINGKINTGDVVLLYFASHGFLLDRDSTKFRLAGSNFNFMKQKSRSIGFKEDVLVFLDKIVGCKKLLFIDACHSGAIANDDVPGIKSNDDPKVPSIASAIAALSSENEGYNMLLSCGPNEKSYENDAWGNGAFTQALLEAFERIEADKDGNGILYMAELYDYVKKRVPLLVSEIKSPPNCLQTPFMPEAHLESDVAIFVWE